ncbi:hypothetical protein KI688_006848 [Linnemannia hyalina]|uniref:Uncharacterized protein n=1 Tax=Linnemannia hyalina TaxID=64524 RepID=A0A9P7XK82_9FUNG|nr:hypothetical protein KI688_006848 [Linnemannia hyalina]
MGSTYNARINYFKARLKHPHKSHHQNDLPHRTLARSPQTRIKNATGVPTEDVIRRTNHYFPTAIRTISFKRNMTSLKACILLLVAAAAAEAVYFANGAGDQHHVIANQHECVNFPTWLNDKATGYFIAAPWRCDVFADHNCGGYNMRLGPTKTWTNVPMGGISSLWCWMV